jgi:hypothetical protein
MAGYSLERYHDGERNAVDWVGGVFCTGFTYLMRSLNMDIAGEHKLRKKSE